MQSVAHNESIEVLSPAECWEYLSSTELGRIAVMGSDGVEIFPINYMTDGKTIFFRSAPGEKLVALTASPLAAFEIDGSSGAAHWSVVARGEARRLNSDLEIEASGVLGLYTMSPTQKWNYVALEPTSITGRRFSAVPRIPDPRHRVGAGAVA